jgi:hypothetical protein
MGKEMAVPVQNLGSGRGPVMFEEGNVREPGYGPDYPDSDDKDDQRQGGDRPGDRPEEDLFHGRTLLLPIAVRMLMITPSTEGTGVNASAPASAPERADNEQERDADENVDEWIV